MAFDPSTSLGTSFNWMVSFYFFLLFPLFFWGLYPLWLTFFLGCFKVVLSQFNFIWEGLIFISIFFYIIYINGLGLIPYFFSLSSHAVFTFSVAFPMWLGVWLTKIYPFYDFLSSFCPPSTPFMLINFMVLVETVSVLIQPLTLSIRLTANITAGHILLGLAGSSLSFLMSEMLLMILEFSVSLVQGYVMTTLLFMFFI